MKYQVQIAASAKKSLKVHVHLVQQTENEDLKRI